MSDSGEFMRIKKGALEVGLWTDMMHKPHLVVEVDTVHKALVDTWPEAFNIIEEKDEETKK